MSYSNNPVTLTPEELQDMLWTDEHLLKHITIKELLLATLKEKWQADTELANIAVMVMAP